MFTSRNIVSPRRWRKQRQKKKFNEKRKTQQDKCRHPNDDVTASGRWSSKILPRESSESCRDVRGHIETTESHRERFIEKRPSLWELSGGTHKTATRPSVKPLSLDRIKRETRDPYIVSSEDWSTTSSASEFVHIKPETPSTKLKRASSLKQLLLEDMRQKHENDSRLDELKFPLRETSDTSIYQLDLEDEKDGAPASFTNLATWRVKKEDQVDFQISMWKVSTSNTKHVTLESLSQFDRVVIEKTNPKYTFIQTSKLVSCH